MTVQVSIAARNAMIDVLADLIDAGASAGKLYIRTGDPPATPETADSGTLLAELTFSDPAYGAASAAEATNATITGDSSANATGTAGHYRVKDSNAVTIWQGTVGAIGSGADLELNTVSITSGDPVVVLSFPFNIPESC